MVKAIVPISIFIIVVFIIFILIYHNVSIVEDTGTIKLLLLSIGLIIYFISNLFLTYTTYTECSFNFLLKHSGLMLTLCIFYLMTKINLELGINPRRYLSSNCHINENYDAVSKDNMEINASYIKSVKSDIGSSQNKSSKVRSSIHKFIKTKTISQNNKECEVNESILKKVKNVISLHFQMLIIYISSLTIIIFLILKNITNKEKLVFKQSISGEFFHKCELEKCDLALNMFELIIFFLLLVHCNHLLSFYEIFKYTKYLYLAVKVGIVFGPLINVIIKNIILFIYI